MFTLVKGAPLPLTEENITVTDLYFTGQILICQYIYLL